MITSTTLFLLGVVLLCICLTDLGMSIYIVISTRQVASTLAAITEASRQELVQHLVANRVVAEHAAEAATEAFTEANNTNAKIARIAQSQATASRAEDDARAEQLQSIAAVGEDTNKDVKDVKNAVVAAETSAASAASSAKESATAARQ